MDASAVVEKTCAQCGVVKPLDDYHRDKKRRDGRVSRCKPCAREVALRYWYANYERNRERQRQHLYDPGRMEKRLVAAHLHRVRHPEKCNARSIVNRAIRDGKMARQPCEKCGTPNANAHHEDYSKPLEVHWMCSTCHGIEHRKSPEGRAQAERAKERAA